jgi:uncharacterized coiled-coil DUF342 family protein
MFNLFPKYGSPGDSVSPEELVNRNNNIYPTWTWTTGIKDADGNDISVTDLISKYNTLLNENKILREELESIEEDGTEEHNAAIKLRQENAQLKIDLDNFKVGAAAWNTQYDQEVARNTKLEDKVKELENEIKNWRTGVMHWKDLYDEKADYVNELVKEVKGLRHLKEENVELIEKVAELQKPAIEIPYRDGVTFKDAQLQVIRNDFKKCAEQRDEFKHQLNAANKEIEALKKEYEVRLKELHNDVVDVNNENKALKKEKAILERWKHEQLIVNEMWNKVDIYVRNHDDAPLGDFVANTCFNFLKERDELKKRVDGLSLTIDRKNFEIDDLKAEIEKLKEDIVDYVIEKDDKLNEAKETIDVLKNMKTQGFEDYNPRDFEKDDDVKKTQDWNRLVHGVETEKAIDWMADEGIPDGEEEPQKHPMYPLHWGGLDKIKVTTSSTNNWQCPCNKCKDKREGKLETTLEEKINKLEKQIEELKIVRIWQKQF